MTSRCPRKSDARHATYTYDPYGRPIETSGTSNNPFGFAGEYTDNESGLTYLRARYYDPDTAQFLTRDPLAAVSREPYGYAMSNPVNNTDPTGLWCPLGKNPNGSCRGSGAVQTAGDIAEGAVGAVGDVVKSTPAGRALDLGSRVTGHSVGVCAGGSLFGGYDLMGSLCYMATPSGESGFTVTVGGGGAAPWGLSGLVGLSMSNAQQGCDFDGTSGYGWASAGEHYAGAGGSASVSDGGIWQATVGWAPGYRVPAPFSFGGGVSRTWTLGW